MAKDWSFSIGPSNEYSGLISFRMDWLDLLAVQRTLQSLLQHHSSKASILRCSAPCGPALMSGQVVAPKTAGLFNLETRLVLCGAGTRPAPQPSVPPPSRRVVSPPWVWSQLSGSRGRVASGTHCLSMTICPLPGASGGCQPVGVVKSFTVDCPARGR